MVDPFFPRCLNFTITSTNFSAILILGSCLLVSRLQSNGAWVPGLLLRDFLWFTFLFFFQSDLPTPSGTHSTLNEKKRGGLISNHRLGDQNFPRKKQGQGLTVPTTHVRQIFSVVGKRLGEPCYPLFLHLPLRKQLSGSEGEYTQWWLYLKRPLKSWKCVYTGHFSCDLFCDFLQV